RETMSPRGSDLAKAKFKTLSRQQQALGRRVAGVGDAYQRILWEFENNRLLDPAKVRDAEAVTTGPLANLAKEAFPATARQGDEFGRGGDEGVRKGGFSGYDEILARLQAIIDVMVQYETLAALIEQLRGVIKVEDRSVQEVEKRIKEAAERTFGRDKK